MIKSSIILLITAGLFSCGQGRDEMCRKLRRGIFYYKTNSAFGGSMITRVDTAQLVTDRQTGKQQSQRIEWIGPCSYRLFPEAGDSLHPYLSPITVEILDINRDYYTVHVTGKDYKADFYDTVWISGYMGQHE